MRAIDADAFDERVRAAGGMSEEELTEDFKDGVQAVLYMLSNQPTIQSEPHWIPCSAELPKTNDPVNVTYVNHNPGNYYAEVKDKPYTATAHFHKGQWYWYSCTTQDLLDEYGTWIPDLIDKDVEITAWKPLPEPFKGVTE